MIKDRKVIVIIPARGGSKGVPRKNIRIIGGKPLIVHSIECAKAAKYIDYVFVSTDNLEIAEVSRKHGAEIIMRPAELAADDTPMISVLKHAADYVETKENIKVDILVLLQPTSPLRRKEYVDACIEKMADTSCGSVTTVSKPGHNPFTFVQLTEDKTRYLLGKPMVTVRQNLPTVYRIDSAVMLVTKEALSNQTNYIVAEDNRAIIIPEEDAIDIDTIMDFQVAEMIISKRNDTKMRKK